MAFDFFDQPIPRQLAAVYVAYFGRAADPEGRGFWRAEYDRAVANEKSPQATLDNIAESFRLSAEAQTLFPFLDPDNAATADENDIRAFVTDVFQNLFNREPDAEGLDFWTGEIQARLDAGIKLGDLLIDIVSGAVDSSEGQDATTIRNKVLAADAYTDELAGTPAAFDMDDARALAGRMTGNVGEGDAQAAGRDLASGGSGLALRDDDVTVDEDGQVRFPPLDNDAILTGEPAAVSLGGQAPNGEATVGDDGSIAYTPRPDFNGSDSLTYTVTTPSGAKASARIAVTVTAVNDAPVASQDARRLDEDTTAILDVLANDSDADGDTLRVSRVSDPRDGTVTIRPDGWIAYTPDPNFNGRDSFTYTVADDAGATDTASVNVLVSALQDRPVAVDDTAETVGREPVTIDVLANDNDPEGEPLTVGIETPPDDGRVDLGGDGVVIYTADEGFVGTDSFVYSVTTADGREARASVEVVVADTAPPQQPPPSGTAALDVSFAGSPALDGLETEIDGALQAAWGNWTAVLDFDPSATIELRVDTTDNPNLLASAGTGFSVTSGETTATPLPSDVARELQGQGDVNGTLADAILNISTSSLDRLKFDTDDTGDIDAVTLFTHELGHPLGFLSAGGGLTSTWDSLVETRAGDLFFAGTNATAANGGAAPRLDDAGTAHLSETVFGEALMTPILGPGTAQGPSDLEVAILQDLGYVAADPLIG